MRKSFLSLIIVSLFCTAKLMANGMEENHPVMPYSIDFTQANPKGLPDNANETWTYDKWSQIQLPEYWVTGMWSPTTMECTFYGADGKKKSGYTVVGMHNDQSAANAWTITPELFLEKGKTYEISYTFKRFPGLIKNTNPAEPLLMTEKFEVCLSNDKVADNLQKNIINTHETNSDEYENGSSTATIEETGSYYIGLHLISDAAPQPIADYNYTYLCLGSFSIKETVNIIPNPVSALSVTPDPNKKLSARLSWTNPDKLTNGDKIEEKMEVEIYRNNELIQTLSNITPGTVSEFEDKQVPQAGFYEYAVRVKVGEKYSIKTTAEQCEIGSLSIEATLPYQIDFTVAPYGKADDSNPICTWEKWTKINSTETTAGVWNEQLDELNYSESKSGICAYCQHTNTADAWAISPIMYFEGGKAYAVTYSYKKFSKANTEYKEKFELAFGKEKTAEAIKQNIITSCEVDNTEYKTETMIIQIKESGEYCIGIHCISEATNNNISNLCFENFSIEETVAIKPKGISSQVVIPSHTEMFVADLSWTNPTEGINDRPIEGTLKAQIFRDGKLIKELSDIQSGSKTEWSDKVGKEGEYTYTVSIGWKGIYNDAVSLGSCTLKSFIPNNITDLQGTAKGKEITLTWTNPSVYSYNGSTPSEIPLPEKMHVDIYRDAALIATIENQAPGSNGEYKDNVPSEKKWLYWVICKLDNEVKGNSSNMINVDITPIVRPSAPINLKAEADIKTELQVNLSWTNPTRGMNDENLSGSQFNALIFKNNQLVETLQYLDAGSETKWSDNVEKDGTYIYSVSLELNKAYSDTIDVSCHVEYFKPANITDFTYKMEENKCILRWKVPEKYTNGNELKNKMSVSLYCNEKIMTTFENQEPGTSGKYEDILKDGDKKEYFLIVTLPNGTNSERSKTIQVNYTSGIDMQHSVSAYYDNTNGTLYIGQTTDITIYNVSGVCVLNKAKVSKTLNLNELPSGIYFINIGEKTIKTMKIVK